MNKLDEILEQYRKETLDFWKKPLTDIERMQEWRYTEEHYAEEAKQAIIELIEGEIIGRDLTEKDFDAKVLPQILNIINISKKEQRQKLQKLKE